MSTDDALVRVVAAVSPLDERTRVLKHGDTFAVFGHDGDIHGGGLGEAGLYRDGTRHLSRWQLELAGARPCFLSSTIRDENDQLTVVLTNPDLLQRGEVVLALGTLEIVQRKFLWQSACHQQLRISNHGPLPITTTLGLRFAADFADVFEVRGMSRTGRGVDLPARLEPGLVVIAYRGRDEVVRRTRLRFQPAPTALDPAGARFELCLLPQQELTLQVMIACEREDEELAAVGFDDARLQLEADLQRYSAWSCHLRSSNARVDAWINRAVADLYMLTTELDTGPYPYAGVPWFNTPFGRDGIVTALECLWLRPGLARGVLAYLAAHQADAVVPEEDAEPGKILHETRRGEMAACNEMPFRRYYGSVDATPLFVVLAGAYWRRTGDRTFVHALWPHVLRALAWIDEHGDIDGDGFVEYLRRRPSGLLHQGWKDSDDAVFHADGRDAVGPIALCEVQAYVHAAKREAATLAAMLGHEAVAVRLDAEAEALRERFERAFWCEELGSYAYALDGVKQQCRVRTSNAGHCLFAGIASNVHAQQVARTLLAPPSFCGWGIRTLAAGEARFNPMGYHTGAVWPHDNAIVAAGLARYGMTEAATRIWGGLLEAARWLDLQRMPELFCGFAQQPGEGPVPYPVACAPQAWAAGAVFMTLQACLGLEIDGVAQHVRFMRPQLPSGLSELFIHNLEVGGGSCDLRLVRHDDDVGVHVLRREGELRVTVAK